MFSYAFLLVSAISSPCVTWLLSLGSENRLYTCVYIYIYMYTQLRFDDNINIFSLSEIQNCRMFDIFFEWFWCSSEVISWWTVASAFFEIGSWPKIKKIIFIASQCVARYICAWCFTWIQILGICTSVSVSIAILLLIIITNENNETSNNHDYNDNTINDS